MVEPRFVVPPTERVPESVRLGTDSVLTVRALMLAVVMLAVVMVVEAVVEVAKLDVPETTRVDDRRAAPVAVSVPVVCESEEIEFEVKVPMFPVVPKRLVDEAVVA